MNQFTHHVESIVRPIAASQRRKLRMRTELLAHLHATLDEERERTPADEPAAIGRAVRRLGDPRELADALQRTVPTAERMLLAPLAIPRRLDALERRLAQFPGKRGPMTLGHTTLLAGLAALVSAPFLVAMRSLATPGTPAIHLALAFAVLPILAVPLLIASFRFAFVAAEPRTRGPAMLVRGTAILVLQVALAAFDAYVMVDRAATIREVAGVAIGSLVTLAIAGVLARRVAAWRKPYDEWLSLAVAVA